MIWVSSGLDFHFKFNQNGYFVIRDHITVIYDMGIIRISVATVATDVFQINWFSVRNKIGRIAKVFVDIGPLSFWGPLYSRILWQFYQFYFSH